MSERIESNRLEAGQAEATTTVLDRMLSGLGVEPPLTADPIELPMQAFVRGRRVKVYDYPMTRERLQGWGLCWSSSSTGAAGGRDLKSSCGASSSRTTTEQRSNGLSGRRRKG